MQQIREVLTSLICFNNCLYLFKYFTFTMRFIWLILIFSIIYNHTQAQTAFIDGQRNYVRVVDAIHHKQDTLIKQCEAIGLGWPIKQLYIRSFKYDRELEVWGRQSNNEPFKLFKTYKVCAIAGSLGPKRMEGDFQIPEGFYYINVFNPKSTYHLSLGLNYPNASDRILSDSLHPGGEIFIHGDCVTVGCIPIKDNQIEEVYLLAAYAKNAGQDFIPVHVFPARYNNKKSIEYLCHMVQDNTTLQQFFDNLQQGYNYFEQNKQLPIITINKKGEYGFINKE